MACSVWTSRVLRTHGAIFSLLLSFASGCDRAAPAPAALPPVEVSVVAVELGTAPAPYEFVAQTAASRTVEIRARVPGFLWRRPFEEGGEVQEGDLLFQLDQRSYQADVEIAQARLAQAEASTALARVTVQRLEDAAERGGASPQEVDEAKARLQEAEAGIRLARGNLANAELNLEYTTVLSPLQGRVGKSMVYEGAFVDTTDNSFLATVIQTDPIYVEFNISERDVLEWQTDVMSGALTLEGVADPIAPGTPETDEIRLQRLRRTQAARVNVSLEFSDGSEYDHLGTLNFVDVTVDPETGTADVRAQFPNPTGLIKPGQFVEARILGFQRPNTIMIPQGAVIQQPTGQYVYTMDRSGPDDGVGVAELRRVVTGQWVGDQWIVLEGLAPGDLLIVDNLLTLRPGAAVRVRPQAGD